LLTILVFLVEDNPLIASHLSSALGELATADIVAKAESQHEEIEWLAAHKGRWHLAIVDLFLKEGNGLEVVRWTTGREAWQKVVVLTNYASEQARTLCLQAGADRVFDKSTELDSFFEICNSMSNSHQVRHRE